MKTVAIFISVATALTMLLLLLYSVIFGKSTVTTKNTEVDGELSEHLLSLVIESQTEAIERTSESVHQAKDGTWVSTTNRWIEFKKIPVPLDSKEVAEYVQIALLETKRVIKIPDNVVPIAEIQGETIIVTFLDPDHENLRANPPYPGAGDGYVEVSINLKTKTIRSILEPPN